MTASPEIPDDIMQAAWESCFRTWKAEIFDLIARAILVESERAEAAERAADELRDLFAVPASIIEDRAYSRGVSDERERCARVAEGLDPVTGDRAKLWLAHSLYDDMRKHVATAIRRGG